MLDPVPGELTLAHDTMRLRVEARDDEALLRRLRAATGANAECRVTTPGHWEGGSPGWLVEVLAPRDVAEIVAARWSALWHEERVSCSMQQVSPAPPAPSLTRYVCARSREQLHFVLDAAEWLGLTYTAEHYQWGSHDSGYVVRVALTGNDPPSEEWVRTGRESLEGER